MITRNSHGLKVEKSDFVLTSFAGIALLSELARHSGLSARLDQLSRLWQRKRNYSTSDYVMGLAMTMICGGEGLDDTRILRADPGLREMVFSQLPAANSFGRFLERFGHHSIHQLAQINADEALRHVESGQTVTLDIDSSLIESDKE